MTKDEIIEQGRRSFLLESWKNPYQRGTHEWYWWFEGIDREEQLWAEHINSCGGQHDTHTV